MARFSFGIFGQDSNTLLAGLLVKIKNVTSNEFVASTAPEGSQLKITDNNDGTYYVDGLPSGIYSVYVNSDTNVQEELQNIVFLNEDVLNHVADESIHRKINDVGSSATDLWSAEKIQAELDQKAAQGEMEILEIEVDGKADEEHTHPYLPAIGVSDDFKIENSILKFNPNFASEDILSESKTLNQNLELLQAAIRDVATGGMMSHKHYALFPLYFLNSEQVQISDEEIVVDLYPHGGGGPDVSEELPFQYRVLGFSFSCNDSHTSGPGNGIIQAEIYKNSVKQLWSSAYNQDEVTKGGVYYDQIEQGVFNMAPGDSLSVKFRLTETPGETLTVSKMRCIIWCERLSQYSGI